MKIIFDSVSKEYIFPLSRNDFRLIKEIIPSEIVRRIRSIRCGCNTKTTQEGRLVQHGAIFDIRINFCLRDAKSSLLSDRPEYVAQISKFGGKVDLSKKIVFWNLEAAKSYAYFILLHEIAHIIYSETYLDGRMSPKESPSEEEWCDNFAISKLGAHIIKDIRRG